ncbi:N-acetylmuramoyl-L-alanine amidase family protein, partial [Domibacillus iocasae]
MTLLLNDVGHGRNTYPPSKGVPGLAEHTFNAAVGQEVKRLLTSKVSTYEAQPLGGLDISLNERTRQYNAQYAKDKTAIGISHHANANAKKDVRGIGIFYWHTSKTGKALAELLLSEYKKEFPDLPVWGTGLFPSVPKTWTNLHMCRETDAPFLLVEWGFMTNAEDLALLKSDSYGKRCALVTARTVCKHYGITFNTGNTSPAGTPSTITAPKKEESTLASELYQLSNAAIKNSTRTVLN